MPRSPSRNACRKPNTTPRPHNPVMLERSRDRSEAEVAAESKHPTAIPLAGSWGIFLQTRLCINAREGI